MAFSVPFMSQLQPHKKKEMEARHPSRPPHGANSPAPVDGASGHGGAKSVHTLAIGTGDILTLAYQYLFKMSERGVPLPMLCPDTVCYEHHFPRGWYHHDDASPEF